MSEAARVIGLAKTAQERSDWLAFAALLHPDGVFCTIPSGERPAGRAETIELFRQAHADPLYRFAGFEIVPFDDCAGVTVASIRRRLARGAGWIEARRVTLITVADGLLYRMVEVPGEAEGRTLYEQHGPGLGLLLPSA